MRVSSTLICAALSGALGLSLSQASATADPWAQAAPVSEHSNHATSAQRRSRTAHTRVRMSAARAAALAAVPHGKVVSEDLERENGHLLYSFDIRVPNSPGVEEVQVDATTGKIFSQKHESAAAERREKMQEQSHRRARSRPDR